MSNAPPRKLFVAGASGATGKVFVRLADEHGVSIVPHLRPKRAAGGTVDPRAAVVELGDAKALRAAMQGCTSVLQLIGTMRQRFAQGDTYETSDIGTTAQLLAAAREVGVDHLLLLSSVGAGKPVGAYLKAKASAEALVTESGVPFTIFRPSALEGGERKSIPGLRAITSLLRMDRYRPIALEELAGAMLHCAQQRSPLGAILEGSSLWQAVASAAQPTH